MATIDRTRPLSVAELHGLKLPEMEVTVLPNGVTVHVLSSSEMDDVVRVAAVLPGGTVECGSQQLAQLTVSQLREGTVRHTGEQIADIIDSAGAWLKADSATHMRRVVLSALTRHAADNVRLMAEMLSEPVYPDEVFEMNAQRMAARQELDMQKVAVRASAQMWSLLFGRDSVLGHTSTPDEIRMLKASSARAAHSRLMRSSGTHVYVAGKVTQALRDEICGIFSDFKPGPDVGGDCPGSGIMLNPEPGVHRIEMPDSQQSAMLMGIVAIPREHPDYLPLRMAVTALGGYFGSRLMSNIREDKGYTYGIQSALQGLREGGLVRIATECDPQYVDGVMEQTAMELRRLATDPPTGDELLRLRRSVLTELASTLDNVLTVMAYHVIGCTGEFDASSYFAEQSRLADTVTPELIAEMAARYLVPDRMVTVIAGR